MYIYNIVTPRRGLINTGRRRRRSFPSLYTAAVASSPSSVRSSNPTHPASDRARVHIYYIYIGLTGPNPVHVYNILLQRIIETNLISRLPRYNQVPASH